MAAISPFAPGHRVGAMSPVVDATTSEREVSVATAVDAVRRGEVVVLPTDTVYGIGADAFDPEAVAAVLMAKGRGRDMPPPVLVPDTRTVDGLARNVPDEARRLIDAFWPGPLTLVLWAQPSLHWDLGETEGTVALRMPDDEVALDVLRETGPLAVTSANRTGEPAATNVTEAAIQLGPSVSVYVDGGPRTSLQASTIIDCTGDVPVVLREGAIDHGQLEDVLGADFDRVAEDAAAEGDGAQDGGAQDGGADEMPDPQPGDLPTYDEEDPEVAAAEAARLEALDETGQAPGTQQWEDPTEPTTDTEDPR